MTRLTEFISYLEEQVKNHSIYVWGAQGQMHPTITEGWIAGRETSDENARRAISYWHKQVNAGYGGVLRAFDCSGLAMYWLKNLKGIYTSDASANTLLGRCTAIGRADLGLGDWVFRVNTAGRAYHIGYIVDPALSVIEAMGRDAGVVRRNLNASGAAYWNAYGRPAVFAADIAGEAPGAPAGTFYAVCTGGSVYVRAGRGTEHQKRGIARKGDLMLALPETGGWCEVSLPLNGSMATGYMSAKYVGRAAI